MKPLRLASTLALTAFTLALLATAAYADDISATNQFGSINISSAGITSTNSQLETFNDVHAKKGHSLGNMSFSTGALLSGSIAQGGTFSDVGSKFNIIGSGPGVPHGQIFSGTFVGPIDWNWLAQTGQSVTYTLTGKITGMLYTGRMASGFTTQTIYSTNGQLSQGIGHIRAGSTALVTPEPGTLSLLGAGLFAFGGYYRKFLVNLG